jgi:putative ABC transport system permease protein
MQMITLSYLDLAFLALWVLVLGVVLLLNGFSQTKQLWVATLRMVAQLLLMGVWLTWVFNANQFIWVALVGLVMLAFAGYEIVKRQTYVFAKHGSYVIGLLSLSLTALLVTAMVLVLVVQPTPWWEPQYAIPLLGMVLGNSMTTVGIGLDTITKNALQQKAAIEAQLALGRTAKQAIQFVREQSLHTAMIPIINMLVAAGIVSLPGMMTGQILAGADPMEAVKYQIMIMLLITVSTGSGVLIALWIAGKKLFDERDRLNIAQLIQQKS